MDYSLKWTLGLIPFCIWFTSVGMHVDIKRNRKYDFWMIHTQSENCDSPSSHKWPLSRWMVKVMACVIWKGLSQGSCIPNMNALSLILQKIWHLLSFATKGQTDEWVLVFLAFANAIHFVWHHILCVVYRQIDIMCLFSNVIFIWIIIIVVYVCL